MSLATTTSKARRVLFIILLAVIGIMVIDTAIKFLNSSSNPFVTKASFYVAADAKIGTVPVPNLTPAVPIVISDTVTPTFLIEGDFPTFPPTGRVYAINKPALKLTTVENAIATASTLGFNGNNYTEVDSDNLSWENSQHTRVLKFNKTTKSWSMVTQYFQDVQALKTKTVKAESDYANIITNDLSSLGFSDSTLTSPVVITKFAKMNNNGLFSNPVNQSGADFVSINVFRTLQLTSIIAKSALPESLKNLTYPSDIIGRVYRSDPRYGSFSAIASNSAATQTDIFQFSFTAFEYSGAYTVRNLVTPEEAWSNVSLGKGALVALQLQTADYYSDYLQNANVSKFALDAKSTTIAYYEPATWDGWAYPIYIFKGRAELSDGKTANFIFYVDALRRIS